MLSQLVKLVMVRGSIPAAAKVKKVLISFLLDLNLKKISR